MRELVGHRMYTGKWNAEYRSMKESEDLYLVKTHDVPEDAAKCIYVVRDGRAAVVSYKHYLKDFSNKDLPLTDIIIGIDQFGSWGSHLDAWDPLHRPNTLLVQYERLLSDPEEECRKISEFLGLDITGQWKNDFKSFQKVNPSFFRSGGQEQSVRELTGDNLDIFLMFHADWMKKLGYIDNNEMPKYNFKILREVTREVYERLNDSLKDRSRQIRHKDQELVTLREKINEKSDEAARLEETLMQKNQYIDELLNSFSWRITKPVRVVADLFRKRS